MSFFMLSPGIEDRGEVEVTTGRSTKRRSTLNDIQVGHRLRAREKSRLPILIKLLKLFTLTWVFFDTFHLQIMPKKK
jgi:hypothetical protein